MKKLTLKFIFSLFLLAFSYLGKSQGTVVLTLKNNVVNGNVWTFDVYMAGDATYVGPNANDWSFMNIRMDIAVPTGVTINSGSAAGNPLFMDATGAGVSKAVPGNPPPGSIEMGINLTRNGQTDLSLTPVRVASVSVNFNFTTTPINGSEPITFRTGTTTSGSFWTNVATGLAQPFSLPTGTTLPITLVSFNAVKANSKVNLTWVVSSEINAKGYDVERSGNGSSFTVIANVPAVGSSNYSNTDANPLSGVNYYRLKMIDIDGKFKYSNVRTVLFDGSAVLFDIYPNPVVTSKLYLHLQQNNYAGKAQAIIADIAGRSVQSTNINVVKGNNELPLTVKSLNSGTYFVTIYDASGVSITESKKLVKQ